MREARVHSPRGYQAPEKIPNCYDGNLPPINYPIPDCSV